MTADRSPGARRVATTLPPDGFKPLRHAGAFAEHNGPLYYRRLEDGTFVYGFHADRRHANINGVVHGGMLFTFADHLMGRMAAAESGRNCATVTLNVEYLAPGRIGTWIEGRARPLRITRTLAFMHGEVTWEHRVLMTADGVWKLFESLRREEA